MMTLYSYRHYLEDLIKNDEVNLRFCLENFGKCVGGEQSGFWMAEINRHQELIAQRKVTLKRLIPKTP